MIRYCGSAKVIIKQSLKDLASAKKANIKLCQPKGNTLIIIVDRHTVLILIKNHSSKIYVVYRVLKNKYEDIKNCPDSTIMLA